MNIRKAKKSDLPNIHVLNNIYATKTTPEEYINPTDISLVAVDKDKIVGFVWVGLMAKNTFAYIDYFMVHPDYKKKGIGHKLGKKALKVAKKKGVERCFGVIAHNKYFNNSGVNALKMAMGADTDTFSYVSGHINTMIKEKQAWAETANRLQIR